MSCKHSTDWSPDWLSAPVVRQSATSWRSQQLGKFAMRLTTSQYIYVCASVVVHGKQSKEIEE